MALKPGVIGVAWGRSKRKFEDNGSARHCNLLTDLSTLQASRAAAPPGRTMTPCPAARNRGGIGVSAEGAVRLVLGITMFVFVPFS